MDSENIEKYENIHFKKEICMNNAIVFIQ